MVRGANWARPMLARITLRLKIGREPTDDEVDDQIIRLSEKSVSLPPFDAITAAFENGEEVCPFRRCVHIWAANQCTLQKIYPWKLECDDYEEDLQREIARAFPHHEREAVRSKKQSCM